MAFSLPKFGNSSTSVTSGGGPGAVNTGAKSATDYRVSTQASGSMPGEDNSAIVAGAIVLLAVVVVGAGLINAKISVGK